LADYRLPQNKINYWKKVIENAQICSSPPEPYGGSETFELCRSGHLPQSCVATDRSKQQRVVGNNNDGGINNDNDDDNTDSN
jgi:hypothetical protein